MKRALIFLIAGPLMVGVILALWAMQNTRANVVAGIMFWLTVPISALAGSIDARLVYSHTVWQRAARTAVAGAIIPLVALSSMIAFPPLLMLFLASLRPNLLGLGIFAAVCGASTGVCSLLASRYSGK